MKQDDVNAFTDAYLECLLWQATDDDGRPLDDDYDVSDIADTSEAEADCADFVEANSTDLEGMSPEQAGHDFCLTRNRHGAGFWDRGLGALGDRLTAACRPYGEQDVYVGDDGKLYLS